MKSALILLVLCALAAGGCAGSAQQRRPSSSPVAKPIPTDTTVGATKATAVKLCNATNTDYLYIANYRCGDGSMPLNGDRRAGGRARVGNVGPGPDGHIVDLYKVPCPGGAVRIHVDSYHCPPGVKKPKIDLRKLNAAQLERFRAAFRATEVMGFDLKSLKLRKMLMMMIISDEWMKVRICASFLIPVQDDKSYKYNPHLMAQLVISSAAATIERGKKPDARFQVAAAAAEGVMRFYDTLLKHKGESARHAHLDKLKALQKAGKLRDFIRRDYCQEK